jgi:hypothetical protein
MSCYSSHEKLGTANRAGDWGFAGHRVLHRTCDATLASHTQVRRDHGETLTPHCRLIEYALNLAEKLLNKHPLST